MFIDFILAWLFAGVIWFLIIMWFISKSADQMVEKGILNYANANENPYDDKTNIIKVIALIALLPVLGPVIIFTIVQFLKQ